MEKRNWVDRVKASLSGQCIVCDLLKRSTTIRVAAWSPDRKQEVVNDAEKKEVYLVDHKLFDGYDLTLWKTIVSTGEYVYMIGLNSNNYSPFDEDIVNQNQPGTTTKPKQNLQDGLDIIQSWSKQYGKLLIGTPNEKKSTTYLKLLSRTLEKSGFKLELASPGDFTMGYFLIPPGA